MEREVSSPRLQEPATSAYSESDLKSYYYDYFVTFCENFMYGLRVGLIVWI
jgi:hypothetical protein